MTKIVHCKKSPYDVYIGRGSLFGNPFKIGIDGTREEVIEKYKEYFDDKIRKDMRFRISVFDLKGKILGCWCKPKCCHGDIIVKFLEEKNE